VVNSDQVAEGCPERLQVAYVLAADGFECEWESFVVVPGVI
jgi:hypothetical protein